MSKIDKTVISIGSLVFILGLIWIWLTLHSPCSPILPEETPVPIEVKNCDEGCVDQYLRSISKIWSTVTEITNQVRIGSTVSLSKAQQDAWDLVKSFDSLKVPIVFRKFHSDSLKSYLALAKAIDGKIAGDLEAFNSGVDVSSEYIKRANAEFSRVMNTCGYGKPSNLVACRP